MPVGLADLNKNKIVLCAVLPTGQIIISSLIIDSIFVILSSEEKK